MDSKKEKYNLHQINGIMNADRLEVFNNILESYGKAVMQMAIQQVIEKEYDMDILFKALKYHNNFLEKVIPVFPALIALSCEAAGGKKEEVTEIGAALTLFVEAANIQDDIIDKTLNKYKRKTTFGKYGSVISLLAGDILLVQAAFMLYNSCQHLPEKQKEKIVQLTFQALIKISNSAAKESILQNNLNISPKEYLEIVRLRAAVPEAHCMIGGIIGGGTPEIVQALGMFGRDYGIAGTVIDEFIDLLDYDKFQARLKNECLPLPILYAFKNRRTKESIMPMISRLEVTKADYENIVNIIKESKNVKELKKEILSLLKDSEQRIKQNLEINMARKDLSTLIETLIGLISTF